MLWLTFFYFKIFSSFRCSLFIVQGEVGTYSHCLVSDLLDVNINSTVEEMSKKTEIRIPWGSGIVGHVASSAKSVNISDCYASEKFNPVSHQFRIFSPLGAIQIRRQLNRGGRGQKLTIAVHYYTQYGFKKNGPKKNDYWDFKIF